MRRNIHYYTLLLLLIFMLAHKLKRFIMAFSYSSPLPHCPSPLWLVSSHPPKTHVSTLVSPVIIYNCVHLCLCSHWFIIWCHNGRSEKPPLVLLFPHLSRIFLSVSETVSSCSPDLSCNSRQCSCLCLSSAGITEEVHRSQLCNPLKERQRGSRE